MWLQTAFVEAINYVLFAVDFKFFESLLHSWRITLTVLRNYEPFSQVHGYQTIVSCITHLSHTEVE